MTSPLIDVAELAAIHEDSGVRVVDVRWYLGEPERGRAAYAAGHLPGAVFADLETELSAPVGPGRHPLPERADFIATMGRLGIGDDHHVVAYDDRGGAIASRLWWMLRDIGHEEVRVLDGGLPAWVAARHPLTVAIAHIVPAVLTVRPGTTRRIDRETLAGRLGTVTLLDVRDPERYRGELEPVDPVAGHIPTARNAPLTDNLDRRGRFRSTAELAQLYQGLGADDDVVLYCGSGVTACHSALAMQVAGLPEPILYPGSWSDWSSAGMAVTVGDDPGAVP